MNISINPRRMLMLGALGIVAATTLGFAATNTVPDSNAGSGGAGISGYAVTNVHYVLNSSDPRNLDSITFTLTPGLAASGATKVSLNGGTSWLAGPCTSSGPGATSTITCSATGTTVLSLSNLHVVAAQ